MGKVVNLRSRRKRRAREEAGNKADANAFKHGESKAARRLREARAELDERRLAGHRRDARGDASKDGAEEEE